MYGNGLYYDYANMTLNQVVEAFMADQGIESSQIAFSYKNTKTNEQFSMNDTQPMTAGSTYKLPLNMLVMDEVNKGKLSLTERLILLILSMNTKVNMIIMLLLSVVQ